jgi:hypothetical protein
MKTEEDDFLEYDDDEAVKFIFKQVPKELKKRINEDMINYVLDVIYDFYDGKGYIEENETTDEADIDEEEMLDFVMKAVKKDGMDLTVDEVQFILDGEFDYGKSIGIYSEEDEE